MKLKLHFLLILLITTITSFAQLPVTNGLITSYEFNNDLNDGIGTNNLAASTGNASFALDRSNNQNASLFVNKTAHQGNVFSGLNNAVSISFWASFLPTSSATERVLQIYDVVHGGGFRIEYNRSFGEIKFLAKTENTGDVTRTSTLNTTASGEWNHFTVTIEVSNGTVDGKVYINGNLDTNLSMNFTAGGDLFSNTGQLVISPFNGATNPSAYSGYIDDIYIYDRVLSSAEASLISNYNAITNVVYVDGNASGSNDGSSWTNAYTDLNNALANANINDEIWVAKGRYIPSLFATKTFLVNDDNVKIYGGFAGTETTRQERDINLIHTTNQTILSGDLNGNDDANVSFGNATRTDNSNSVVGILKNGVTLNGLTIADGYADGLAGSDRYGAGVFLTQAATTFTIENCILKDNVAYWAAGMYINPSLNSNITINACIFENNLGVLTGAFYALPEQGTTMNLSISNCLFNGNRTDDDSVTDANNVRNGIGSPAGWIRAANLSSIINTTLVNNTFVNNIALGTGANTDFPVLGISKSSLNNLTSTNTIANNIFWGNTKNNGQTSTSIGSVIDIINFTENQISNNIDEDGFTTLGVGVGLINNSNTNPNLTADFKLQATSTAAIDAGNNSAIPTGITLDLAGNNRIENTTVDIGAYEYATTLSTDDFSFNNFRIYPNPASSYVHIASEKDIKSITVYSMLGKRLITNKGSKTININRLSRGVYLMKIHFSNQSESKAIRFIKQ